MTLTTREADFSARYNELVEQAGLAQHSSVRWCMVIKPYGYAIWENMQRILDSMFKFTGHQNAYFPLLIPKSYFSKEAKHVEWFATEAAIVTHYRLKRDEATNEIIVDPEAKLEEELIIRPTSETIIWNTYKDRIKSYRDLPLLIKFSGQMSWDGKWGPGCFCVRLNFCDKKDIQLMQLLKMLLMKPRKCELFTKNSMKKFLRWAGFVEKSLQMRDLREQKIPLQ